tara:strand:+ start:12636 stop:13031 length:396 start_codon:yes stop_codon:yes gene_type:complete
MIRQENFPFQIDRPTFVKVPFTAAGKAWQRGDHFPWKELAVDGNKVRILYNQRTLMHDSTKEVGMKVGDGLEALDSDGLSGLVDTINKKVKDNCPTTREYDLKRCRKSRLADKQRGMIRSWRRNNGDLENC